jgi:hypothetical protein
MQGVRCLCDRDHEAQVEKQLERRDRSMRLGGVPPGHRYVEAWGDVAGVYGGSRTGHVPTSY